MSDIVFTHEALVEPRTFSSRDELIEWADAELTFWNDLKFSGSQKASQDLREAQRAWERLRDAARQTDTPDKDLLNALATVSRDVHLLSTDAKADVLKGMVELGYSPFAVTMAYAAFFARNEVAHMIRYDQHLFDCVAALSHVGAFEVGGDPQRLVEFLRTTQEREAELDEAVRLSKEHVTATATARDIAITELRSSIDDGRSAVRDTIAAFDRDLNEIRDKFEKQFALRTPMTYWTEKATRHLKASAIYRWWFSGLLLAGVVSLALVGYFWLFPFLTKHPSSYWALILYSVAIALLAWPLRLTSRLYLAHKHLFEDATEREVIARTFLALGEQVQLSDSDRQLLLSALMRPASIALAGDDSGLNLADLIAARTLMKS